MKQKTALNILKAGRNVYLTGAAGSGKTYVLNSYIQYLKERGVGVGVTASTGIAATHIGGTTIHSWSGIGIKDDLSERDIDALVQKERLYKQFNRTSVLIIDEVSMLSPSIFDALNRVAKAMKQSPKPFGGMQVVLSGDFFQLPPITRFRTDVHFIPESNAWHEMDVRVCYLDEQFRHEDATLEAILGEMRNGALTSESRTLLEERGKEIEGSDAVPTRLFTHNKDVDALNDTELDKLPGTGEVFTMETRGRKALVETLKKGLLVPEELRLKKNAAVMFVKNNFDEGYVNGTLGTVIDIEEGVPVVKTFSGHTIYVHPAEWSIEEDGKVLAQVFQIPLRLAWAITVHKSQGMSLDAAEIDLSQAFVPGQGYVALSRLRSLEGLVLKGINRTAFDVHPGVFELDKRLLFESKKWEKVVARFTDEEMQHMHDEFIRASGGTTDEKEIAKIKARAEEESEEKLKEKVPTHIATKNLLDEGLSLAAIAEKRGLTLGTVIGHIEKLKAEGTTVDLSDSKPDESDLKKIKAAFEKAGDTKLAPVYKTLAGTYTYEELRLARLFL